MKIVGQTPTKLILREVAWLLWSVCGSFLLPIQFLFSSADLGTKFFAGVLFPSIGLFVAARYGQIMTYTFDKTRGRMFEKRQGLIGTKVIEHRIETISGVQLQEGSTPEPGKSPTYRIILVLASGRSVPLGLFYSSGLRGKQAIAETIATFFNVKNYGLQTAPELKQSPFAKDFARLYNVKNNPGAEAAINPTDSELTWQTLEEEIAHWQATIHTNPKDAEAHKNLGIALWKQDQKANKKEALAKLKKATDLFKAQRDEESYTAAFYIYSMMFWGMLPKK